MRPEQTQSSELAKNPRWHGARRTDRRVSCVEMYLFCYNYSCFEKKTWARPRLWFISTRDAWLDLPLKVRFERIDDGAFECCDWRRRSSRRCPHLLSWCAPRSQDFSGGALATHKRINLRKEKEISLGALTRRHKVDT